MPARHSEKAWGTSTIPAAGPRPRDHEARGLLGARHHLPPGAGVAHLALQRVATGGEPVVEGQRDVGHLAGPNASARFSHSVVAANTVAALRIAQREGEDGIGRVGQEPHAHAHRARRALLEDLGAQARAVLRPPLDDHRGAAARDLRLGLALAVGRGPREVELQIAARDVPGRADLHDLAALEQHRAVAEALDLVHVVRDEQDRAPLALGLVQDVVALLLERGIAHGEHLVDEQEVRVDVDHHREREPDLHARRVVLQLEVLELVQLGEVDDRVVALAASSGVRPSITALRRTLSCAVRSGLKPTPSSMNGAMRPRSQISPASAL